MTKKKRSVAKFMNPFEQLDGKKEEIEQEEITEQNEKPHPDLGMDQDENERKHIPSGFLDQFYNKKETQEDTHTRKTFLVRNELLHDIEKYSKKFGYGFQVKFINEAIRRQLEIIKEEEKRLKSKRRK